MKRRSMGWVTVFMLFIVYMLNYMDRAALSITAPLIEKELGFNAAELGMVFSAFFVGYVIFNFVGGMASDKSGPKLVFVFAVTLWSLFCGMTALAVGLTSILIIRVLFGMAEGPISSAGNKMVNNWISRNETAVAVGFFSAGSPLGGAIAGPVVGFLAIAVGWRWAFIIICCIGLVWTLVWYAIATDTAKNNRFVDKEEQKELENKNDILIKGAARVDKNSPGLGYYMKQPIVLATAVAFFSYNYVLYFFLTWFPSYLNQAMHLDIKQLSIATVIPWLVGAVGMVIGGAFSDYIYRLTGRALFSRKLVLGSCLAGTAICVAISGNVTTVQSAIILMSCSLFLLYLTGAIYWAIIQDVVHKDKVGSVGGAMHGIANTSGIIGPLVTGFIVQATGDFSMAFFLAGAVALVGAVLVIFCIKDKTSVKSFKVDQGI
ncbi:MFS transporter [Sodalis sp. dw_96]|uniref:MFS transporter n=1 Tax=Sodalis sp. dw_96 TaxID=2719794 RepID=UPI001BD2F0FA|nr:MFS transporter [Sodalis sp. dw_96]